MNKEITQSVCTRTFSSLAQCVIRSSRQLSATAEQTQQPSPPSPASLNIVCVCGSRSESTT